MVRAIGVMAFGGPDVLQVVEVPADELGPRGVRIKVAAASVNPTDGLLRAGAHAGRDPDRPPPYVPGMDLAGTVVEWGPDVEGFAVGDEVMGIVLPRGVRGAYRDEIVLTARSVTHVPAGSSLVEAATVPMNALTARQTLDQLALAPGQVLAVTGAAGTLGGYVIQLAKADGLVVVADASKADEELVRSSGADVVVRRGDDVATRFRRERPRGVDGLVDAAVMDAAVVSAVRAGGRMTSLRGYAGDGGEVEVVPTFVSEYFRHREALDVIKAQVEAGVLTPRVAGTLPAEDAPEAHRRLAVGGQRGRTVLLF